MPTKQTINNIRQQIEQHTAKIHETQTLIIKTPELADLAQDELEKLNQQKTALEKTLDQLRRKSHRSQHSQAGLPAEQDAIVEIRAAAGGDEAGLFATELYRMYLKFSEQQGWKTHQISVSEGGWRNIKEVCFEIVGTKQNPVYPKLKFESGVHRVQRVPKTESADRIHTSTATVAVLPKIPPQEINLKPQDLKIETFRARGPGGQSVNTTDSAVRITHLPTKINVSVQNEKSQHQNRQKALEILSARLAQFMRQQQKENLDELRSEQIKMGERSEKIRTYNFPQHRLTDHRISKSWYNLQQILEGNMEEVVKEITTTR